MGIAADIIRPVVTQLETLAALKPAKIIKSFDVHNQTVLEQLKAEAAAYVGGVIYVGYLGTPSTEKISRRGLNMKGEIQFAVMHKTRDTIYEQRIDTVDDYMTAILEAMIKLEWTMNSNYLPAAADANGIYTGLMSFTKEQIFQFI